MKRRIVRYVGVVFVVTAVFVAGSIYYMARPARGVYLPNDASSSEASVAAIEPLRHFLRDKVLARVFPNVTNYSSRYAEAAFQAIALGTTMEQVQLALGDPLHRTMAPGGGEIWLYSEQGDPLRDYLVRGLEFDKSGHVTEKLTDFYID